MFPRNPLHHPDPDPAAGGGLPPKPAPLPPTNEDILRRIEALEKKDWTPAIEEKLKALREELSTKPAPDPAPKAKSKPKDRAFYEEE